MSFYLLWVPLKVPHRVGGSADAGLSTENSSEQVPVELGWSKTAVSKSNLIWQISEKKIKFMLHKTLWSLVEFQDDCEIDIN